MAAQWLTELAGKRKPAEAGKVYHVGIVLGCLGERENLVNGMSAKY